ncbi:hypothetical protein DAI22_12g215700 [Oryza sativa Japonica Group]|nr:hypothetical protein DAI22_12g215700 [Oryza sativa Japonica Group]
MSAQIAPAEQVCYVHCNFCNTILAVSVPGNSMLNIVTVRCGHCTNLLSVNLRGLMHSAPALQDHHHHHLQESGLSGCFRDQSGYPEFGFSAASSSSKLRLPPAAAAMVSYSQQNQQLEQALHARRKRYEGSKQTTPTLATGKPSAQQPRIGHIIQTSILA